MTNDDKKADDESLSRSVIAPAEASVSEDPAPQPAPVTPEEPMPQQPVPDLNSVPAFGGPDPDYVPPKAEPVVHQPRRGGFIAPLLGGALAAVAGFALSHYNVLDLRADGAQTEARLSALENGLESAKTEAGSLASAASQKAGEALTLVQELSQSAGQGAEANISALEARLSESEAALQALAAAAPDGSVPPAAFASLKAEIDALKAGSATAQSAPDPEAIRALIGAEMDARAAEITARAEEEAERLRDAARREAAVNTLIEGVNNGQPYAAALAGLELDSPPAALSAHAETGIPSLAGLAASFPEAARQALEASLRGEGGQSLSDRAWAMLRIGTGARSLSPREGSDPDAVLSRAEAAVKTGDLATALSELEALPAPGKSAMSAWTDQARTRLEAASALAALSAQQSQ